MSESGVIQLDILEDKINKAITLITQLENEKNALVEANKELKGKIETLYITNEELNKEVESLRNKQVSDTAYAKTREEIKTKIAEILAKLEKLDI